MHLENFSNFTPGNFWEITIVNDKKLKSQGFDDVKLKTDTQHYVTLKNVLYCPTYKAMSVKRVTENNIKVTFEKQLCSFVKENDIILTAKLDDNFENRKTIKDIVYGRTHKCITTMKIPYPFCITGWAIKFLSRLDILSKTKWSKVSKSIPANMKQSVRNILRVNKHLHPTHMRQKQIKRGINPNSFRFA